MHLRFLSGVMMAALTVTGCCGPCRTYQKQVRPLVETRWQLVQLNGQAVEAEGEQFTLHFAASGDVSGMAACNRLMGGYTTTEDRALKIGPLAATRMMCYDEREMEFMIMLDRVTHYEMDGPMMMLLSDGSLVGVMEAREAKEE